MGFGATFEGVGTTIGPTGFRPTLLSFSVYSTSNIPSQAEASANRSLF